MHTSLADIRALVKNQIQAKKQEIVFNDSDKQNSPSKEEIKLLEKSPVSPPVLEVPKEGISFN
jgi:hypothetical protein